MEQPNIRQMQDEWHDSWRAKRRWIVVEEADGYSIHEHTADSIAPPFTYPNKRLLASRFLQLLGVGPVAPQTHPEQVCVGTIDRE